MSKLADLILTVADPRTGPGTPCSIATALDQLDPDSADDLRAYFAGRIRGVTDTMMHAALLKAGQRVGKQTVGRHRRRECRCFEAEA